MNAEESLAVKRLQRRLSSGAGVDISTLTPVDGPKLKFGCCGFLPNTQRLCLSPLSCLVLCVPWRCEMWSKMSEPKCVLTLLALMPLPVGHQGGVPLSAPLSAVSVLWGHAPCLSKIIKTFYFIMILKRLLYIMDLRFNFLLYFGIYPSFGEVIVSNV